MEGRRVFPEENPPKIEVEDDTPHTLEDMLVSRGELFCLNKIRFKPFTHKL